MNDSDVRSLITSIYILKITGISRATLNNYINMGLIPKPVVRKADDPTIRARKVGFFPHTVLDRIKTILSMKAEGHSLKHIIETLTVLPMSQVMEAKDHKSNGDTEKGNIDKKGQSLQEEPFPETQIKYREQPITYIASEGIQQQIMERTYSQLEIIYGIFEKQQFSMISHCVLVAELQAIEKVCAELPADQYFSLLNDIWKAVNICFKKYHGTYGKCHDMEIVYHFLMNKTSNYLTDALLCALEIRESIRKLSLQRQLTREEFGDIHINMGIADGQDYFGIIPESPHIGFNVLGDTVRHAALLAQSPPPGSVWTTKNLINKLSVEELRKIRFGIRRVEGNREIFYEKRFGRIKDLFSNVDPDQSKYCDIALLAVTEIIDVMP